MEQLQHLASSLALFGVREADLKINRDFYDSLHNEINSEPVQYFSAGHSAEGPKDRSKISMVFGVVKINITPLD